MKVMLWCIGVDKVGALSGYGSRSSFPMLCTICHQQTAHPLFDTSDASFIKSEKSCSRSDRISLNTVHDVGGCNHLRHRYLDLQ